jgi:endonuclease/exonuclease/phosphatase family metal-dependent hydrolase
MMTTNILADEFNTDANYKNAAYRAEIYAGILIAYTPDVVGVQESDTSWSPLLDKYIAQINEEYGYNYARLYSTYESMVNFTSLIYRADKLSVGTSGVQVFNWWYTHSTPTYHMRNITWAQFTLKSNTSKKFIFANTHWSYRLEHQDKYGTDTLRTQNKDETETFLSTMKSKYSTMPIFLVGDFNTSVGYFIKNDYNNYWLVSQCNLISTQASSNGTLITAIPTSNYFDHIFGTGTYTVKRYDHFTTPNYKNKLSDHPFVYTDLAM